jgi:xylulokinase
VSPGASPPVLAGLDIGSTHCKAVLATPDGTVLARAQRRTPRGADGHTHPVRGLVRAALDALDTCLRDTGHVPDAVGLTGMAEAGAPLAPDGHALTPVLAWSDPAPAPYAERLAAAHRADALHARTGVLPGARTPLAKWCAAAADGTLAPGARWTWAGAADLVAHALTGRTGTDATFAQRTMAWDPLTGDWIPELLAEAGLRTDHMPAVRPPGAPAGRVTAEAAAATGLRTGTPVVVAGHDHLVGAWAAGARGPGRVADSMGTTEAVVTVAAEPPDMAAAGREGMAWGRHADGAHWILLAGMRSSGALVEWFCDRFLGLSGAPAEERYAAFAALAGAGHDAPTGLVVTPYHDGRASPRPDPGAGLDVHGLGAHHGLADLARGLLEGAAHHARWMTETQAALTGTAPASVTLLGGSTRQRTWTALKAAVSPWPVLLCAEPEAPALGAALWSGAALGLDPAAAPPRVTPCTADPGSAAAHRGEHHRRFLALVSAGPPPEDAAPGPPVHDPGPPEEDPGQSGDTSGSARDAPGPPGDSPGSSGRKPEPPGDTPGPTGDTSGSARDAPGPPGDSPGSSGRKPEPPGDTPGQSGDTSGSAGDAPGPPGDSPGSSGRKPEPPGDTPGPPGDTPGPTGDTSGSARDAPGPPGDDPGPDGPAAPTRTHAGDHA